MDDNWDSQIPFLHDSPTDFRYPTRDDDLESDDTLAISLASGIIWQEIGDVQSIAHPAEAGWWWAFERVCVISSPPTQMSLDSRGRLHNERGPALMFRDGWMIYCLNGVNVPANAVLAPDTITVAQIDEQTNAEIRRTLIECYGLGRYIQDSGAIEIQRDCFGILYQRLMGTDEPIRVVKVINRTPEPDGSYREYFIRVPPTLRTAHEAVAWTFGLSPAGYHPGFES